MTKKLFLLITLCSVYAFSNAQTNIGGTVNDYEAVSTFRSATQSVSVASSNAFSVGDLVLIIQMQGAEIDETLTDNFGTINNYNNSGKYEFQRICRITGNQLFFQNQFKYAYQESGKIQLVRVPEYQNGISLTGILTGKSWDGSSGGIVAIKCNGTLDLDAFSITMTGKGFRGGEALASGGGCIFVNQTTQYTDRNSTNDRALKGEGIANYITGKEASRGPQANGGGGGNNHNGGGSGGANYGIGGAGGQRVKSSNFTCGSVAGLNSKSMATKINAGRVFMGGGGGAGAGLGGGIFNNGGNINSINVTIAYNKAQGGQGRFLNATSGYAAGGTDGEGYGGGIFNRSGTVDLNNSLIAYNRNINDIENANLTGIESDEDLFGSFTSTSGSNLVFNLGAGSLGGNTLGNIISADPELMPLADNGGTTFTHAILPCPQGPAVNAGNDAAAPTLDQREMPRNDAADIGSFESDLAEINLSYSMIQPCENSSNGSITVTPQSTPDYIYQWDVSTGNQTESTAIGLVAGFYTVTITDGNGCVKDTTFELIQAPNPSLDPFTNQEECESFTLLEITGTNLSGDESYYTESGGLGTSLIEGDVITSTQTIYMYDLLGNCADEVSFDVIIHELPEVLSFTGEGEYCEGELPQNIIVEVSGVSDFTLEYTINGAQASIVSSEQNIDLGNTPGVYMITGIQDEFCENTSDLTQSIIVHLLPSAPETSGDQSFCTNEMILPIEAQADPGSHSWYSDEGLTQFLSAEDQYLPENTPGIDTYYVTSTENDCEGPAQAVVIEIKICDVVIPTAFTPNDDDVNDIWNIVNIDLVYPNNVVRVYNRLGNKVYESQKGKYQEMPWNGFYNLEALPVASYYYIIEYNDDNNKSDTGYVSIIK